MHCQCLPEELVVVILRSLDARSIARAACTCRAFWCPRLDVVLAAVRQRFPFADRCGVLRVDVDDRAAAFSYPKGPLGNCAHVVEKKATRPKLRLNATTATEWMYHIERLYDWTQRLSASLLQTSDHRGDSVHSHRLARLARLSVPPWASHTEPVSLPPTRDRLLLRALNALADAPPPLIRLFCIPAAVSLMMGTYDACVRAMAVRVCFLSVVLACSAYITDVAPMAAAVVMRARLSRIMST